MKVFAVPFGVLICFTFANAFQNYATNYGKVNRTQPGYQGANQWGNQFQGIPYGKYNPNSAYNHQQQVPLNYPRQYPVGQQQVPLNYPRQYPVGQQQVPLNYPTQYQVGQQQVPLTYPAPSYPTNYHGTQQQVGWVNPYQQPSVGQQQMNLNYDPYDNQQAVKEEWIVPVKVSLQYDQNRKANFQPAETYNPQQAPVKTNYYTK